MKNFQKDLIKVFDEAGVYYERINENEIAVPIPLNILPIEGAANTLTEDEIFENEKRHPLSDGECWIHLNFKDIKTGFIDWVGVVEYIDYIPEEEEENEDE